MTYDTVNISDHFHLICWVYYICHCTSIWYVDCIISVIQLLSDMLTVSYMEVEWHMIQSTYQIEVEWQIWYSQHIRWKWNDRYNTVRISDGSGMTDIIQSGYLIPLPSDVLTISYLSFHFHLICWVYYICHSPSIWYVDCIISVIQFLSDMSGMTDMIQSAYQMEVEWEI
jgi:TRAP-type mannitol/chloroaromatic compound transport system permease small subunit